MRWERISSDPISTQTLVAVRSVDGQEGYAAVRWVSGPGGGRHPELFGRVWRNTYDAAGSLESERREIIDDNPQF